MIDILGTNIPRNQTYLNVVISRIRRVVTDAWAPTTVYVQSAILRPKAYVVR